MSTPPATPRSQAGQNCTWNLKLATRFHQNHTSPGVALLLPEILCSAQLASGTRQWSPGQNCQPQSRLEHRGQTYHFCSTQAFCHKGAQSWPPPRTPSSFRRLESQNGEALLSKFCFSSNSISVCIHYPPSRRGVINREGKRGRSHAGRPLSYLPTRFLIS